MLELRDGTRKTDKQFIYSFEYASNQYWSTFGARTNHGRLQTHKTHHGPDLGEATTFPHIIYYVPLHEACIQMVFCLETPKGESWNYQGWKLPQLCRAITPRSNLQLGWGLKQSCSSHQELSNDVLHATCTHGGRVDSRLFVVGSQIPNLTLGLSFCHNLCCRRPNGSCDPILYIYTSINFQWYKKPSHCKCFDLFNYSLKVRESTGTPTPKMGAHLGMWIFILTLFHTYLGPHPCNSFCLGCEPKARVATTTM